MRSSAKRWKLTKGDKKSDRTPGDEKKTPQTVVVFGPGRTSRTKRMYLVKASEQDDADTETTV